jgi:hypothetical protein
VQRRCGPPPDRYRLGCAAPRGPKGVLYLCRPMASNSTLQRPTAQRRRRRRRNPQVCGGERGQPNWITGALGPGRRGVHARGSAEPALPCSSPNRLQAKYVVSQSDVANRSVDLRAADAATNTPGWSRAPAAAFHPLKLPALDCFHHRHEYWFHHAFLDHLVPSYD